MVALEVVVERVERVTPEPRLHRDRGAADRHRLLRRHAAAAAAAAGADDRADHDRRSHDRGPLVTPAAATAALLVRHLHFRVAS